MDIFFQDRRNNMLISWKNLIQDISKIHSYNPYCKSDNYYEIFKQIILSIILRKEIILLDADFTNDELQKLTGYSDFEHFSEEIYGSNIHETTSKAELLDLLKTAHNSWKITLYTSGTTGLPKKVSHHFDSITRFVKYAEHNKDCIWGFAYNPTHMAGLQVFLQALFNGNKIVRLFGLLPDEILREIKDNKITHISATPTFYKLLMPCIDIFPSVKRITSGGEKFNEQLKIKLAVVFPNAKIYNIYASTEAGTLLASENDLFIVKNELKSLIKIEDNELLIDKSLLGLADMEIDNWYHTGDLIEIVSEDPLKFRFISRKSEMINVGGYKVNPNEVTEVILQIPGVTDAYVYARTNSVLGNIIYCDIIKSTDELNESLVRTFLSGKIQEFKIPRIIRFVNELTITRTGKLKKG